MSLASIAFSRLSTKVITPLSSTIIPKLGSISSGGVSGSSSSAISLFQPQQLLLHHHQPQKPSSKIIISIRSVFSEVIRQIPSDDPQKQGALTFEDPDLADARIGRNIRGESPLRRRMRFVRHEKGWMRRKRLKMERRYLRLQEGVEELKTYIKFKQEYKR